MADELIVVDLEHTLIDLDHLHLLLTLRVQNNCVFHCWKDVLSAEVHHKVARRILCRHLVG